MTELIRDELATSISDSIPKQSKIPKICPKCKLKKSIIDFGKDSYTNDGLKSSCKKCHQKYDSQPKVKLMKKHYQESLRGKQMKDKYHYSPEGIYVVIKSSASRRNLTCNLSREEFIKWYNKQEKICHYCNKTEKDSLNDMNRKMKRLSIDRKDNNKGYELNNIVLACYKCNMIKSNDISYEKMLKIGEIIKNG